MSIPNGIFGILFQYGHSLCLWNPRQTFPDSCQCSLADSFHCKQLLIRCLLNVELAFKSCIYKGLSNLRIYSVDISDWTKKKCLWETAVKAFEPLGVFLIEWICSVVLYTTPDFYIVAAIAFSYFSETDEKGNVFFIINRPGIRGAFPFFHFMDASFFVLSPWFAHRHPFPVLQGNCREFFFRAWVFLSVAQ